MTFRAMPNKRNVSLRFMARSRLMTEVVVGPGDYLIGSDGGCDITLADDTVDPEHCIISWDGDNLSVEDLMSLYGVIVNHRRVTSTRIRSHDTVRIGRETLLVFRPSRPAPSGPATLTGTILEIYGAPPKKYGSAEVTREKPEPEIGAARKLLTASLNLKFEGDLSDFCMPEIVDCIAGGGKTGTLFVTTQDRNIGIHFKDGKAVYATPSLTRDKIGEILVAKGAVEPTALYQGLKKQKKLRRKGKLLRLGTILVEMGALDADALVDLISGQIKTALSEILAETRGTFTFEPRWEFDAEDVLADFDVSGVLRGTLVDIKTLNEIKRKVPSAQVIFQVNADPSTVTDINLALEEWKVLSLIDGERDVTKLSEVAGFPVIKTLKILSKLVDIDVVERAPGDENAASPRGRRSLPERSRAHKGILKRIVNRLRRS